MKIFLFAEYYQNYLDNFYLNHDCSAYDYRDHQDVLLRDYFGSFVSYKNYFERLGHEVELVIGNDFLLQNKWLSEHCLKTKATNSNKKNVVLTQVKEFNPDVFFMGSMFPYYGNFLAEVSKVTKNIFTWIACPYPKNTDFSNIRCVISSVQEFVNQFRSKGLNSEVLEAAFDADITDYFDGQKTMDVSFVGGMVRKSHGRRVKGLEYVLNNGVDLVTYGYGLRSAFFPFRRSPLLRTYKGELWGMEMYKGLNNSRITLNFHIDVVNGWTGNMRLYEATGCGALLITENTSDLNQKFRIDEEVIVYDDFADLVNKIKYYVAHDNERESISKAGQKACFERHGYDKRIREFENILYKYL